MLKSYHSWLNYRAITHWQLYFFPWQPCSVIWCYVNETNDWHFYEGSNRLILTHWGWDKMANIWQTTISNAFSWKKTSEFKKKWNHWNVFFGVKLTISDIRTSPALVLTQFSWNNLALAPEGLNLFALNCAWRNHEYVFIFFIISWL